MRYQAKPFSVEVRKRRLHLAGEGLPVEGATKRMQISKVMKATRASADRLFAKFSLFNRHPQVELSPRRPVPMLMPIRGLNPISRGIILRSGGFSQTLLLNATF